MDDLKKFFADAYLRVNPGATQEQIDEEFVRFVEHVSVMAEEYARSPYYLNKYSIVINSGGDME